MQKNYGYIVGASCRHTIIGIITNYSKISSHPNSIQWPPLAPKTINEKCLQYLLCFASQKWSWRYFVWDYVKRIHYTIQGFPCQKKKNQILLIRNPRVTKLQKHSTSVQLHYFLCLSQRKIGVFLIGIDFVCLIKG